MRSLIFLITILLSGCVYHSVNHPSNESVQVIEELEKKDSNNILQVPYATVRNGGGDAIIKSIKRRDLPEPWLEPAVDNQEIK